MELPRIGKNLVGIVATGLLTISIAGVSLGAEPSPRVEVGQEAPPFVLESLTGEQLGPEGLRGESSLVLIFFRGTW